MGDKKHDHAEIKVKAGYMVLIKTKVSGGPKYVKEDLTQETDGKADVKTWETTRRIDDWKEYERACKVRDKARATIKGACYWTPFREICPVDQARDYYHLDMVSDAGPWAKKSVTLKSSEDGWVIEYDDDQIVEVKPQVEIEGPLFVDAMIGQIETGAVLTFGVDGDLPPFAARLVDISLLGKMDQATELVRVYNEGIAEGSLADLCESLNLESGATNRRVVAAMLAAGRDEEVVTALLQAGASEVQASRFVGSDVPTVSLITMRGLIVDDEDEALKAVTESIKELLGDMDEAINTGDVGSIRDLARRAGTMGKLLEPESSGKTDLAKAVTAARKICVAITKRVGDEGEALADVIEAADRAPIAAALFAFGDDDFETSGKPDGPELPAVNAQVVDDFEDDDPLPEDFPSPEGDQGGALDLGFDKPRFRWITAHLSGVISDACSVASVEVVTGPSGGDHDTGSITAKVEGYDRQIRIAGFLIEEPMKDVANSPVDMIVVTDGLDSSGGLVSNDSEMVLTYGEIRKVLSGLLAGTSTFIANTEEGYF